MAVYRLWGNSRYRTVVRKRLTPRWKNPERAWLKRWHMAGKHYRVMRHRTGRILDDRRWGYGYWYKDENIMRMLYQ